MNTEAIKEINVEKMVNSTKELANLSKEQLTEPKDFYLNTLVQLNTEELQMNRIIAVAMVVIAGIFSGFSSGVFGTLIFMALQVALNLYAFPFIHKFICEFFDAKKIELNTYNNLWAILTFSNMSVSIIYAFNIPFIAFPLGLIYAAAIMWGLMYFYRDLLNMSKKGIIFVYGCFFLLSLKIIAAAAFFTFMTTINSSLT